MSRCCFFCCSWLLYSLPGPDVYFLLENFLAQRNFKVVRIKHGRILIYKHTFGDSMLFFLTILLLVFISNWRRLIFFPHLLSKEERIHVCDDDPECKLDSCDPASLLRHRKRFHEYSPSHRSPAEPKEVIREVEADSPGSTNVIAAQSCQLSFAEASTSPSWPADMSLHWYSTVSSDGLSHSPSDESVLYQWPADSDPNLLLPLGVHRMLLFFFFIPGWTRDFKLAISESWFRVVWTNGKWIRVGY